MYEYDNHKLHKVIKCHFGSRSASELRTIIKCIVKIIETSDIASYQFNLMVNQSKKYKH